jgi:hypothetical protein
MWRDILTTMFIAYFYWHYVVAPLWLWQLWWTMQQAILRFFSVGLMLRTLFAHWHRDITSYSSGTFGELFMAFAWNQISRGIGFFVRTLLLTFWLVIEALYIGLTLCLFIFFLSWPLLIVLGLMLGLGWIASSV